MFVAKPRGFRFGIPAAATRAAEPYQRGAAAAFIFFGRLLTLLFRRLLLPLRLLGIGQLWWLLLGVFRQSFATHGKRERQRTQKNVPATHNRSLPRIFRTTLVQKPDTCLKARVKFSKISFTRLAVPGA